MSKSIGASDLDHLTRYEEYGNESGGGIQEALDGDFVRLDDVKHLLVSSATNSEATEISPRDATGEASALIINALHSYVKFAATRRIELGALSSEMEEVDAQARAALALQSEVQQEISDAKLGAIDLVGRIVAELVLRDALKGNKAQVDGIIKALVSIVENSGAFVATARPNDMHGRAGGVEAMKANAKAIAEVSVDSVLNPTITGMRWAEAAAAVTGHPGLYYAYLIEKDIRVALNSQNS